MLLNVWLLLVIFTLYVAWCIEIISLCFAVNNSFININILLIEGRDSIYLAYFWVCTKELYKRRFIYFWQTYDNKKIEISVWSSVMSSYISLASLLRSWLIPRSSVCKVSPRVIYQWNWGFNFWNISYELNGSPSFFTTSKYARNGSWRRDSLVSLEISLCCVCPLL